MLLRSQSYQYSQNQVSSDVPNVSEGLEYSSIAAFGPLLDRVFSMRYRSYHGGAYIEKNSSEKFMDQYDSQGNCTSYLTFQGRRPIGSIRSCVFDPKGQNSVPIMEVFGEEFSEVSGGDSIVIEANKFVIDPDFQGSGGVRARFNVFKNIADEICKYSARHLVAGVREEHVRFYQALGFEPKTDARSYPCLNFKTIFVHCSNVDFFCDKIYHKTRFFERNNDPLFNSSNR